MKAQTRLFYGLMFLPLVVVLIALPFLPAQIPAHYDITGQITRWGSKYETFLFPLVTLVFGGITLAKNKSMSPSENPHHLASLIALVVFNLLTGYFLYQDFTKADAVRPLAIDGSQWGFGLLGLAMIILGVIMPRVPFNPILGVRTHWSMKNKITWQKSQQFGGWSFVIGGLLIALLCLMTQGSTVIIGALSILVVILLIDITYTYRLAQKY